MASGERLNRIVGHMLGRGYSMKRVTRELEERYGIVKVGRKVASSVLAPRDSQNTDVNVAAAQVVKGSVPGSTRADGWYIIGTSRWKKNCDIGYSLPNPFYCWFHDFPSGSGDGPWNIGGDDGFAIRYDSQVTQFGAEDPPFATTYDVTDGDWSVSAQTRWAASDSSSYGVGFKGVDRGAYFVNFQGKITNGDYTADYVVATIPIKAPPCNTRINYYTQYMHSWSTTSLTGFNIGRTSFGLSWSSTNHKWSAAGPSYTYKRSC